MNKYKQSKQEMWFLAKITLIMDLILPSAGIKMGLQNSVLGRILTFFPQPSKFHKPNWSDSQLGQITRCSLSLCTSDASRSLRFSGSPPSSKSIFSFDYTLFIHIPTPSRSYIPLLTELSSQNTVNYNISTQVDRSNIFRFIKYIWTMKDICV